MSSRAERLTYRNFKLHAAAGAGAVQERFEFVLMPQNLRVKSRH
jgi:hypothetical protein